MAHNADVATGNPDPEVTERLGRFTRTRDPRALWPDLTESASAEARLAIEHVVRAVLAGETHVVLDAHGKDAIYALTVAGFTMGCGPLLGRWMKDGRVQSPPAVQDVFADQLEHGRRRFERMQRGVLPAFDALLARGITPVAIKGFHLALAYHEEPGVRPMTDVDVVVPATSVADAEAALEASAFLPTSPMSRPYRRNWKAADVDPRAFSLERTDARSRWQLEVHESFNRPFPNEYYARLDSEQHRVAPIDVAGRTILAPVQPLLFLVLACHLSSELGTVRLMRLIDLVRVVRADRANGTLDWVEVMTAFQRTSAARFTYPAMAMAEDLAPGTIDLRALEVARKASTWGVRHTVKRIVPRGGSLERTSLITMFMWDTNPLDIALNAIGKLARSALRRGAGIAEWRALLRRLRSGALSVGAPDERNGLKL